MEDLTSEEEVKETASGEESAESGETDGEVSFSDDSEYYGDEDDALTLKRKKRKKRLIILGSVVGVIVLLFIISSIRGHIADKKAEEEMYTDMPVIRRTISNTITGSAHIEPNDSYNVISMHSGDITADYITEGKTVKKGDKLYQFDDEDAQNQLTSAKNNLTKAQQQYADAVKTRTQTVSANSNQTASARNSVQKALNSLNDAQKSLNDSYVTSDINGKVSAVYVDNGAKIQTGAQIAEVYDDSVMKLRLPFNEFDSANLYEGASAEVSVAGTGEKLIGTVTDVSGGSTATGAHTIITYATIEVANPGALTSSDIGSAVVNGAASSDTASFEYAQTRTITAEASGTIENLNKNTGDAVYAGEQIAHIDSSQLQTSYDNARLSYDDAVLALEKQVLNNDTYSQDSNIKNAGLALDDARLQVQNAQKTVDDYLVEAPIDGTVVTKNAKSGDTIDSSNGTDPLCVIYDLSSVKLSIDVDETEVALIKVGQKATVTADAAEGEFVGEVVKVPVDGVNQNGVTTYTIDIQIKDYGDLLPGMNVDAEIVVEEAENALAIPMNSINRGNIVFVKDDGSKRANDVTDAVKPSEDGKKDKDKDAPEASAAPTAAPMDGGRRAGGKGNLTDNLPKNIEVPEGYRAIVIETGLNDADYIEVKSGLKEGDSVRTLNTLASSEGALDDDMANAMNATMGGGMGGSPGGGGAPGGGAPGGNRGGGNTGGGNTGGGPR